MREAKGGGKSAVFRVLLGRPLLGGSAKPSTAFRRISWTQWVNCEGYRAVLQQDVCLGSSEGEK